MRRQKQNILETKNQNTYTENIKENEYLSDPLFITHDIGAFKKVGNQNATTITKEDKFLG